MNAGVVITVVLNVAHRIRMIVFNVMLIQIEVSMKVNVNVMLITLILALLTNV